MVKFNSILIVITLILGIFVITPNLSAQVSVQEIEKMQKALPDKAPVKVEKPRKLLVFSLSNGYKHSAIPYASMLLELMGEKTGAFETVFSEDMSVFTPEQLNQYDAVCFNNTTQLTFEDPLWRETLMNFVKQGKGIIGLHAATDNFYNWPEAAEMIGGVFAGHPWNASGSWKVKIDDPKSPLTISFQGKDFSVKDEIYRVNKRRLRENNRVLVSLDMTDATNLAAKGVRIDDRDIPISWIRTLEKGRVFYCSFGHNHELYWNPKIVAHYLAGIQFAFGDLKADTTPVPFNIDQAVNISEVQSLLTSLSTYDYGQSLENQTKLNDLLRLTSVSTSLSSRIETELINFLSSDATLAGKQYICHVLSVYGTEKSIPTLADLLDKPETAEMALYALERIPSEAVDEALSDRLDEAEGNTRTGIITALGQRHSTSALPGLIPLMGNKDPLVASAAVRAVGNIGGDRAFEALAEARKLRKNDPLLTDAYLQVADRYAAQGMKDQAFRVYSELYTANEPPQIQYAALRGMILNAEKEASTLILNAIRSGNKNMQSSAIQLVREIPANQDVSPIARMLPELSANNQVQLLSALAGRKEVEVVKMMKTQAKSDTEAIQLAALQSLALSMDPDAVPLFAGIAAAKTGQIRQTARQSLYRINGPGVNEKLISLMPSAGTEIKIEYIQAISERRMEEGIPLLLSALEENDQKIRTEAIKALRAVATAEYMAQILDHLVNPKSETDRRELEKVIVTIASKIPDGQPKATEVIKKLQSAKDKVSRASLLEVLGKIGDPQALPFIRSALSDKDPEIEVAAIRALASWPDSTPIDDLLDVAKNSKNQKFKILALRGYVRLISFETEKSGKEILEMYQTAMSLAKNTEEKRAVLSGLATVESVDALEFAASYIGDKTLQQEAATTIINIAERLNPDQLSGKKPVLYQAKAVVLNEELQEECQEIINELEKFEDFITVWQAAGTYDNQKEDIFTFAFPPETGGQAEWKNVPEKTDPENYWKVDLGKFFGNSGPVGFMRTTILSDKEQEVQLQVGSNDAVKVWLNGELVHQNNVGRENSPGEDKIKARLIKGPNPLMLKIVNLGGAWSGSARVRNPEGGKIEGLKYK